MSVRSVALLDSFDLSASPPDSLRLELKPGEGGGDAAEFAAELAGALKAYLTRQGLTLAVHDLGRATIITASGTPKQLMAAAPTLTVVSGVHRIQRIPKNDSRGRRQTSTATLAVLMESETAREQVPPSEYTVEFYRGSGPGGQHRNKVSTAVRLVHLPTGIRITRESGRSQGANLDSALRQLQGELVRRAGVEGRAAQNEARLAQVAAPSRAAKTWTHNTQRGDSVAHETGQTMALKEFLRGRWERLA